MDVTIRPAVKFEDFLLDHQAEALLLLGPDGTATRVPLGARAFRMLCLFAARQGQIVTRREIMDAVWPDVVVEENNISVQLASLRRVLDAGREGGSAVETVTGRGYRFLPPVVPHLGPVAKPVEQAAAVPRTRRHLSVAVLPFTWSGGVESGTVDAIVETLTVELAQQSSIVVIDRGAALPNREESNDIRRIDGGLNVRYLVEGHVREESDGRLIIQVRLVATDTGEHLWAERFETAPGGRDGTAEAIAREFAYMVYFYAIDDESRRVTRERTADMNAEDVMILAGAMYNLPGSPEKYERLIVLYERVLELEPRSLLGLSGLAESLIQSFDDWDNDPTAPAKLARADALIAQAEASHPEERTVMLARLLLLGKQSRTAELIPLARRAKVRHPNLSSPDMLLGWCHLRAGDPTAAIESLEASIRVHPRNPEIDNRLRMIGFAMLFLGRYEDSVTAQRQALAASIGGGARRRASSHAGIAAALALAGDRSEARESAAEAMRLWPTITARGFVVRGPPTAVMERMSQGLREGLRLAGVRDHADEGLDPGLTSDGLLHTEYEGPTPATVPGARTIRTNDVAALLSQRRPLVLDTSREGDSIPGAIGLWGAGVGGSTEDAYQDRLRVVMIALTKGRTNEPIVTVGWNAERFQGRNLALRLGALGYTEVYWYRGGREAWMAAGEPTTPVSSRDW